MAPESPEGSREFLVRSCAILIHGDRVLMQEGDDGRGGRQYALPGGHVVFGVSLDLCRSGEVYEEAGLIVEVD